MSSGTPIEQRRLPGRKVFWVPVVSLVVHSTDEILAGFPAWATARFGTTTLPFFVYTHLLLLGLLLLATLRIMRRPEAPGWRTFMAAVQVQFVVNALFHIITTLTFLQLTPGSLTAVLVLLPVSYYFVAEVLRRGLLREPHLRVAFGSGIALYALIIASLWLDGDVGWRP